MTRCFPRNCHDILAPMCIALHRVIRLGANPRVVEFAGRSRDEEVAAPRLARASRSTRARKSETCVVWDGVAFDENVLARPTFRETLTLLAGEPVLRKRVISLTGHYIVTRRAYEVARPSWIINNAMLCSSTLRYADPPSSIGKNQGYLAEIAESNRGRRFSRRIIVASSYVMSRARVSSINSIKFTLDRFICARERLRALESDTRADPVFRFERSEHGFRHGLRASEWVSSRDDVLVFHYYEWHYLVSPAGFLLSTPFSSSRLSTCSPVGMFRYSRKRISRCALTWNRESENFAFGLPSRFWALRLARKGKSTDKSRGEIAASAAASTSAIAVRLETREAFSRENSILSRTVSARRLQTVVSDIVYIGRFAT